MQVRTWHCSTETFTALTSHSTESNPKSLPWPARRFTLASSLHGHISYYAFPCSLCPASLALPLFSKQAHFHLLVLTLTVPSKRKILPPGSYRASSHSIRFSSVLTWSRGFLWPLTQSKAAPPFGSFSIPLPRFVFANGTFIPNIFQINILLISLLPPAQWFSVCCGFASQGTFDIVWRYFLLSHWEKGVGSGLLLSTLSAQKRVPATKTIWPKTSVCTAEVKNPCCGH